MVLDGLRWSFVAVIAGAAVWVGCLPEAPLSPEVQWPFVGGNQSNWRYSPADDLNADNVGQLQVAWTWRPDEQPMEEHGTVPGNFTSTPLMIDNVVYASTNYNRVAALDAETGAIKWIYDPKAYEGGMPALAGGFRHRCRVYATRPGLRGWRKRVRNSRFEPHNGPSGLFA